MASDCVGFTWAVGTCPTFHLRILQTQWVSLHLALHLTGSTLISPNVPKQTKAYANRNPSNPMIYVDRTAGSTVKHKIRGIELFCASLHKHSSTTGVAFKKLAKQCKRNPIHFVNELKIRSQTVPQ